MLDANALVVSFGISTTMLLGLYPIAPRLRLIDHPNKRRKLHSRPVPLIGGIGIFFGILGVCLLFAPWQQQSFLFSLLGALVLVAIGVLDDRHAIDYRARVLVQVVAALLLVVGADAQLHDLGDLIGFGRIQLGQAAIPFTVFAVVGLINAFNMVDGIDGLAAGLAVIALVAVTLLSSPDGGASGYVSTVAVAAVVPYLISNLGLFGCKRFKVFLGDAGSMLLGYLVAWALIDASQAPSAIQPVTALWLVAVPLTDVFTVMIWRFARGRSPFSADRDHLHHALLRVCGSPRLTLALLLLASLACAQFGVIALLADFSEAAMFYAALALLFAMVLLRNRWFRNLARAQTSGRRRIGGLDRSNRCVSRGDAGTWPADRSY